MTVKNKHELAEEFSNRQDDHYPNLPYKQMEKEAWLAGYEVLELRLESAEQLLREFADYENPNEPKGVCWPASDYMKKARSHFQKWDKGGA